MSPVYVGDAGEWVSMNATAVPFTTETSLTVEPTAANTYAHYGETNPTLEVIAGTSGQYTISTPGVVADKRFDCYVTINAAGITAANPIIVRANDYRGPATTSTGTAQALLRVINVAEVGAVIVETSRFKPQFSYDQVDCVRLGGKAILRRCDISGSVDGIVMLFDDNQALGNFVHDGIELPTTTQPDGKTHNDGITIGGGARNIARGNRVVGWSNAAIFARVTAPQTYGQILDAIVEANWLGGPSGAVLHVFKAAADPAVSIAVLSNIFDVGSTYDVYVASTVTADIASNTRRDGSAASVTRFTA